MAKSAPIDVPTDLHGRVVERLQEFLQPHVTPSPVDPSAPLDARVSFSAIGLDSFLIMEMVLFVEREFDVKLPLTRIASCTCVDEIATVTNEACEQTSQFDAA